MKTPMGSVNAMHSHTSPVACATPAASATSEYRGIHPTASARKRDQRVYYHSISSSPVLRGCRTNRGTIRSSGPTMATRDTHSAATI